MFDRVRRYRAAGVALGAFASSMALVTMVAGASGAPPSRPIEKNQTDGFAQGLLTAFTYGMNFDCVEAPNEDLDHNGKIMAEDPAEVNGPHCQSGHQPPLDPTGKPIQNTEKLFVIVPFFETNRNYDQNANGLGTTLRSLFGFTPDAFKTPQPGHPENIVPLQCPEPGPPLSKVTGAFGTCTTHTNTIDIGPTLAALGKVPANTIVRVPTPNHSHIIRGADFGNVWWQVVIDFVTDPRVWPDVNGNCAAGGQTCLTSVDALRAAQSRGQALGDVPSNFFLFFGSQPFPHQH
jgi:hypothetical protein